MSIAAIQSIRTTQPSIAVLNPVLPKPTLVYNGTEGLIDLTSNKVAAVTGMAPSTGTGGKGYATLTTGDNAIFGSSDTIFTDNTQATIVVYRKKTDTTLRSVLFGYADSATNRVGISEPFSDGVIYFDFGNATSGAGGGRFSVAGQAFGTNPDCLVYVAHSVRGREIYRNGALLGSDKTANAARPANATGFAIGKGAGLNGGLAGDLETYFMLAIYPVALPSAWCLALSANPWLVFAPDYRNSYTYVQKLLTQFFGSIVESSAISTWNASASRTSDNTNSGVTNTTGSTFTLTSTQPGPAIVTCAPKINYSWTATRSAILGDFVIPTDIVAYPNLYTCTTAGATGSVQPIWPNSGTVTDGSAVWTYVAPLVNPISKLAVF